MGITSGGHYFENTFLDSKERYIVCLDYNVMANQLALEIGGFDWHTI
jgi:hypothetical protein